MRSLLSSLAASEIPATVISFLERPVGEQRALGKLGTSAGDLATEHFQNVGAAAAAAERAHVFVTQADLTVTQRSDGLDNLAGVVGSQVRCCRRRATTRCSASRLKPRPRTRDLRPRAVRAQRSGQPPRDQADAAGGDGARRRTCRFPRRCAHHTESGDAARHAARSDGVSRSAAARRRLHPRDAGDKLKPWSSASRSTRPRSSAPPSSASTTRAAS